MHGRPWQGDRTLDQRPHGGRVAHELARSGSQTAAASDRSRPGRDKLLDHFGLVPGIREATDVLAGYIVDEATNRSADRVGVNSVVAGKSLRNRLSTTNPTPALFGSLQVPQPESCRCPSRRRALAEVPGAS